MYILNHSFQPLPHVFFLMDHSNQMKLYSDKCPKKFHFLFESKCSKGIMSLVSRATTAENFPQWKILTWISLVIWRISGGSKSNKILLLSIFCFISSLSDYGSTPIFFCPSSYIYSRSVNAPRGPYPDVPHHSLFVMQFFQECSNAAKVILEIVKGSCMNNNFMCRLQAGR